ncbi:MAG: hypothetical protein AAGA56_07260 [Myxococcota bacterium]
MPLPLDPASLPGPARKIVGEGAPPKLQMMAAKGVVPGLKPDGLLSVLVLLSRSGKADIAEQAKTTLAELPPPLLKGVLGADLEPAAIEALATYYPNDMNVLEAIVTMPRTPIEAIAVVAEAGGEMAVELVATNESRMLDQPRLIELCYLNKRARMSTVNRLVELAVRNDIELSGIPAWKEIAQAISGELIAEPSDQPLPEDEMFWEQDELAQELTDAREEDAFVETDEVTGEEELKDKFVPLFQRMAEMSVSEKIRRAMLGTKEERMMLIREQNKVVASAAARSPLLQEPEVVLISRNRGITEDVLRIISMTPEWLKSYQVKRNLVQNAKTPIAIAMKLVVQLREADLRRLSKSKNVSAAVQMAARRHLQRRKQ